LFSRSFFVCFLAATINFDEWCGVYVHLG